MTDDQLIELSKKLIAIESTVDNLDGLREAYDFMVKMLRSSGKDITIEEFESGGKPSLLAYRGKTRPANFRVILNGHLDVVPGQPSQYKAVVKDGKLYGRGSHDEKAACVVLADVFCEFIDKVPYALGLQLVTDEESSGYHGTRLQIEDGVRADFVICAECGRKTDVHEIANEAKGIVVAEIGFRGVATHSAYPWRGDSAALKATQFVHALHDRFPWPAEETSHTTITVTSISSTGGSLTRVPDYALVKVDARYIPGDPNFRSRKHFAALIEKIDANAELSIYDFSSPLYTSKDNPLLLALKASAEKVEDAPFRFVRRHATSDGRWYGDVGNQACEFGIAGEDQHGDNEHITLKAFSDFRKTLQDFLTKTIETEKDNTNTHAFSE
ncbi:MAG: M20 family metallopeptidase [Candidatus Saccharimonadales bacterium]